MERTILGDEMGLGKTVEALAAKGHFRLAEGASHFLVVCPAGVVRNWAVEVRKFTTLPSRIRVGGLVETREELSRKQGPLLPGEFQDFFAQGAVSHGGIVRRVSEATNVPAARSRVRTLRFEPKPPVDLLGFDRDEPLNCRDAEGALGRAATIKIWPWSLGLTVMCRSCDPRAERGD